MYDYEEPKGWEDVLSLCDRLTGYDSTDHWDFFAITGLVATQHNFNSSHPPTYNMSENSWQGLFRQVSHDNIVSYSYHLREYQGNQILTANTSSTVHSISNCKEKIIEDGMLDDGRGSWSEFVNNWKVKCIALTSYTDISSSFPDSFQFSESMLAGIAACAQGKGMDPRDIAWISQVNRDPELPAVATTCKATKAWDISDTGVHTNRLDRSLRGTTFVWRGMQWGFVPLHNLTQRTT